MLSLLHKVETDVLRQYLVQLYGWSQEFVKKTALVALVIVVFWWEMANGEKGSRPLEHWFAQPPTLYRPLQIIHNFDALGNDERSRLKVLEHLRNLGIGGLVVNVSFRNYMRSEEQWEIFLSGVEAAKKMGFLLWLYDEEGYPSGAAGGLVLEGHEYLEATGLAMRTGSGGEVRWQRVKMYEGTHCTENVYKKRRYPNILDIRAVERFLDVTHRAYEKRVRNIGQIFQAVFTDEPSLMTTYIKPTPEAAPAIPWSDDLPGEFRRRKGYDIRKFLSSLFLNQGPYREVRSDFYDVVSQLLAERYLGKIQEWCRRNGLFSSGHLLGEEKLVWHAMYYGDLMACLRRMDIPGMDMLTSDPRAIVVGHGFIVPKFVSSAAHINGSYLVMSETSDYAELQAKRRLPPQALRLTAFILHLLGVNIVTSYYTYPYSFSDPDTLSFFKNYCDYVGRLGLVLRNARHVCDVAVLYPITGIWANFYPTARSMYDPHPSDRLREIDDKFVHLCRILLNNHIDFDIVDERAIQEADLKGKNLVVARESYRILIVPDTDSVRLPTLRKLAQLARAGFEILIAGSGKIHRGGLKEDEKEHQRLAAFFFSENRKVPSEGDLVARLMEKRCGLILDPPVPDVWIAHYKKWERHIYPIANISDQTRQVRICLKGSGEHVEIWDLEKGKRVQAETDRHGGYAAVSVTLPPWEGLLITQSGD